MNMAVYVAPHERHEAIEAYRDRLSAEQVEQIKDAPDEALILLTFGINAPGTSLTVIEEG